MRWQQSMTDGKRVKTCPFKSQPTDTHSSECACSRKMLPHVLVQPDGSCNCTLCCCRTARLQLQPALAAPAHHHCCCCRCRCWYLAVQMVTSATMGLWSLAQHPLGCLSGTTPKLVAVAPWPTKMKSWCGGLWMEGGGGGVRYAKVR